MTDFSPQDPRAMREYYVNEIRKRLGLYERRDLRKWLIELEARLMLLNVEIAASVRRNNDFWTCRLIAEGARIQNKIANINVRLLKG